MTTLLPLMLIGSFLTQDAFRVKNDSLPIRSGEISAANAFERACLVASNLQQTSGAQAELCLRYSKNSGRSWVVLWHDSFQVDLNSETGQVETVVNWPKEAIVDRSRPEPATIAIRDEGAARLAAFEFFQKIGAPADLVVEKIDLIGEREQGIGTASATVRKKHLGRRIVGAFGSVTFDRSDGVVVTAQQRWPYVIETEHPTVSASSARSRAESAYAAAVSVPDRFAMSGGEPELAYVRPGDTYGATPYPKDETVLRLRLAFIFAFGSDRIWIDANNGSCIGGTKSKNRPG